jgi:transcriptional regulator with XRE-family HTH domain
MGMTPVIVRLKELRLAKGWTQVELAERAGVRRATVSMLESGKTDSISFNTIDRLSRALEVDPALLFVRKGR